MDRQGFIEFNNILSPGNSGKADSYARAIKILDDVLRYQNVIDLQGRSLYDISDPAVIDEVLLLVKDEVRKMKNHQQNIFDFGASNQKSYPLKNFCSAALKSLKEYAVYEQDMLDADRIVAQEKNPKSISNKLIKHFDITKEGKDEVVMSKHRKGQNYFRHMILVNYNYCCAVTGISVPQLLLASHIIPWKETSHKQDRLNPCNGICLSALYDKAFDAGLITFDEDYKLVLSQELKDYSSDDFYQKHFGDVENKKIILPEEHKPDLNFLQYHYENIFSKHN